MSYTSNFFLNKDISNLKTNVNEMILRFKFFDAKLKKSDKIYKTNNEEINNLRVSVNEKIDKELSSMNNMVVDIISDIQHIRSDLDELISKADLLENYEEKKEKVVKIINEQKYDKYKDTIDFLKSLEIDEEYKDLVIKLGCKKKDDLKLFSEEELKNEGFLLLHARKILLTLNDSKK